MQPPIYNPFPPDQAVSILPLSYDVFETEQILSMVQSLHQHSENERESRRSEITRLYVDEKLPL